MKIYKKFQSLSRLGQISCIVLLAHFLCIFALVMHHWIANHPPKRPIVVRTRSFARQIDKTAAVARPPAQQSAAPPKPASKSAKKSATPSTKPTAKKKVLKVEAPAEPEPILSKNVLFIPALIETPPAPQDAPPTDATYEELLIATFQHALELPERGEVKARLEIDRNGRLVNCTILETKSRKNGEFLTHRLPDLLFPCFSGSELQSFTVTFRNRESR